MQTDAAGFDGYDFVVLAHDAESDQHGNEGAKGSEVIDEIGRQVAKIIDDDEKSDVMARDVVEQLEEGKGFKEKDEHGHDECEINDETAKNINVQKPRDAAAGSGDGMPFSRRRRVERLTELANRGGAQRALYGGENAAAFGRSRRGAASGFRRGIVPCVGAA